MKKILPLAIASALLSACGGGSGDNNGTNTDVTGLAMPASMSVVTASGNNGGNIQKISGNTANKAQGVALNKNATDVDTHYSTDPVNTYVYDASMESLDTVNMILCLMGQTRASDMVNAGAYIALVNENKCEQGQGQSGSTGQSSSGQMTEYNSWVIESSRTDNASPQHVKIWIPGESGGNDPRSGQDILVEVTTSEAVSDSKPFGSFTLNFKGVVDAGNFGGSAGSEMEVMRGTLKTVANNEGLPQFSFVSADGDAIPGVSGLDFAAEQSANVILNDATGSSGVALTHRSETYSDMGNTVTDTATYAIAFDSGHLLRGKDTNADNIADATSCKSRSSFDTQVWRYNLYHAVDGTFNGKAVTGGQRVVLNSGFPFTYDSDSNGSSDAYGFVGYHGVWSQAGNLADGTVINKFDYNSNATSQHTVHVSAGKLMRRTAHNELLSSFQGDDFQYWGQHPTLNMFGQWVVTVDSNNDFQITASMSFGNSGPQFSTTIDDDNNPGTAEVPVAASLTLGNNQNLWLWSDALGGNVVYLQDDAVAAMNRTVTFYAQEVVSPSDSLFASGNVTLHCYDRCLKGGLTQNDITAANGNVMSLYHSYSGSPLLYTLSASNGKLILRDNTSSNAVVSTVGLNLSSVQHDWGISTGEMVVTALANASQPWLIYGEPVTLRWETGNNNWNQLVTVTNAQNVVARFDRPLQLAYTHSTANDANGSSSHNGKKFLLQYGGVGELWGFPWVEDMETHRWQSSVTLADGVTLSDGTNTFLVKAMEKQQTMRDDNANCGALDISSVFTSLSLPNAASIGAVSFTLASKPTVTDAPAVIEGELQ